MVRVSLLRCLSGQEPPRTEDGAADTDGDGDGDGDGLLEPEGDGDGRGPRGRVVIQVTSTAWLADGAAEEEAVAPLVSGDE
jgi:hypothetical protein